MKQAIKIYMRDFTIGMVIYGVLLVGVNIYLYENIDIAPWAKIAVALTPMIGVFLSLRAILVFSRSWDELMRKNIMEAIVISFTVTAMGTFSYGFLEGVGFPEMDTFFVFPLMMGLMGVAQVYTCWWRYR